MKITKIKIKNYRLLKDFDLQLEQILSLIIGKNNSGKTSLIAVLDKFINEKSSTTSAFTCDDFNIDFQKKLKSKVENNEAYDKDYLGISLKLFIKYEDTDDLVNLSTVLMDLDPDNKTVVLLFEYTLSEDDYIKLKSAFIEFKADKAVKIEQRFVAIDGSSEAEIALVEELKQQKYKNLFYDFFKKNYQKFFKIRRKTISYDNSTGVEDEGEYIDLVAENIKLDKILNLRIINARREVSNKENDKSLSYLSSKYYDKNEGSHTDSPAIQQFKDTLSETDDHLDVVYEGLFKGIVEKVAKFGGIKKGDTAIKVVSTLQHKELLKGNTTVMYDHNDEHALPEHYNGLGYMNLIGMIFEIEVLLSDFRKEHKEGENPADINLLFIEEPEAHTHPQMQYVFIKNIKDILLSAASGEGGTKRAFNLQTIITTHSSHITAESQFNDIKYFSKKTTNQVISKSLRDLELEYLTVPGEVGAAEATANYKFLRQYLTLNRAELFFADKAIFIEGDTERIILPAMMKKIDQEFPENPMLSQNISIVEVGAYSHIFEKFINFIGLKSLVITDIDGAKEFDEEQEDGSIKKKMMKCSLDVATHTTNASLKFFHDGNSDFAYYVALKMDYKSRRKKGQKWVANKKGKVLIVYQVAEDNSQTVNYHGRSFEDAFFHLNKSLLETPEHAFESITKLHLKKFLKEEIGLYDFIDKAVGSKPSLAMEILLNSKVDADGNQYANWQTPEYIRQGLLWLKKD